MPQDKEHEIRLQFLEEAQEYLSAIESSIIGLSAAAAIDQQQLDPALRAAHSIKGGAAMMEFQTLSHLAHRLEDVFKGLPTSQPLSPEVEMLLLSGVDCLRQVSEFNRRQQEISQQWLTEQVEPVFDQLEQQLGVLPVAPAAPILLEAGQDEMMAMIFETEVEDYLQRLEALLANPEQPDLATEVATMAQELGELGEMLQLPAFNSLCSSIGQNLAANPEQAAAIAQLATLAWRRSQAAIIAGEVETLPTQIEFGDRSAASAVPALTSTEVEASAENAVIAPPTVTNLAELKLDLAATNTGSDTGENTVRVPLKQLEQLNDLFGELTIERNGITLYLERLRNTVRIMERRFRRVQQSHVRIQTAVDKQEFLSEHSTPAAPATAADLHLLSQEMTQNLLQLQEATDDIDLILKDADQTNDELNWTAKQLQTCITQLRMRPLSDLLGRFPRALRELSLQYGKQVELQIQGDSTLIDRSILEALSDPLMHLLRNAFDHGIESPDIRRSQGKPEQGVIKITAAYAGNQTIITFSDDGSGIDLAKVRARAQQLGLDPVALAAASKADLLSLIFAPGFSTASTVTTLSGRGVGMDVVRTNLSQIRGEIKVDTELGKGTTFILSVPFTLSVARVLLVESKGMLLAFPNQAIAEMVLLNSEQILTAAGTEVLSWQGQLVPLIRLSQWLKFRHRQFSSDSAAQPMMNAPTVLIVAQGQEWIGLQVDRCWGEQEVALRPIEGATLAADSRIRAIAMPPGFTGCTILGDGRVVPLVSTLELLQWIASQQALEQSAAPTPTSTAALPQQTILVVDDSLNIRRFLSLHLEKAGYRVEQAEDGQAALAKLLNGLHPQAVICDVDMPQLNGYEFLSQVKSNPALQQLPIILLTSRSSPLERQQALDLGAIAFFSKPCNKQELLHALAQVVPLV